MVYCNLMKKNKDEVVYAIGGTTSDITGELIINYKNNTYIIAKEPDNSKVYDRHVSAMVYRSMEQFNKGIFPDKLSYEF